MKFIAVEQNVSEDCYKGVLMIYEMSIPEDLQLKRKEKGFTDTLKEA